MTAKAPQLGRRAEVDITPFREAFERLAVQHGSHMKAARVLAVRLNYWKRVPDVTRTLRAVGLRPDHPQRPRSRPRQSVHYEQALKLADALRLAYTDCDV